MCQTFDKHFGIFFAETSSLDQKIQYCENRMYLFWLSISILTADNTVKPVLSGHFKKKTNYRLMQVKFIAEWEHSAILLTFIKLPFVIKIFVLSFFEWLLKTCFTVLTTVLLSS